MKKIIYLVIIYSILGEFLASCNQGNSKDKSAADTTKIDSTKLKPAPVKIDTSSQSILLIGDSMADGLGIPLAKYAKYNKHTFRKCSWQSSSIVYWAGSDTLRKIISRYKPTFIFISLGSNELFTKDMASYKKHLQKIISRIDTIAQVWIEPPVWKPDNGLTALMLQEIGANKMYMSEKLILERGGDNIHPTFNGYHQWADSICVWVMKKSAKPILLKKPPKEIYKKYVSFPGETIYKPAKKDTTGTKTPKSSLSIDSVKKM